MYIFEILQHTFEMLLCSSGAGGGCSVRVKEWLLDLVNSSDLQSASS